MREVKHFPVFWNIQKYWEAMQSVNYILILKLLLKAPHYYVFENIGKLKRKIQGNSEKKHF